ncbi:hypothetical protein J4732_19875 [Serratia marcescens]|uniref:Uncharacterized protein n=1 Tax=Serratia marcescens TaxID=615 RepID=A0A939NLQ1_SERMA|nr:hypothetical protein [Serratia marcescens]
MAALTFPMLLWLFDWLGGRAAPAWRRAWRSRARRADWRAGGAPAAALAIPCWLLPPYEHRANSAGLFVERVTFFAHDVMLIIGTTGQKANFYRAPAQGADAARLVSVCSPLPSTG